MKKLLQIRTVVELNVGCIVDLSTELGRQQYNDFEKDPTNINEVREEFESELKKLVGIVESEMDSLTVTGFEIVEEDIQEEKGE